jgi:SAM-dependent methyltransferase
MHAHIAAAGQAAQHKWNARYLHTTGTPHPAQVLQEHQHLLPPAGRALDLACGLGGNALLLAAHGLETWAWDIADVAVQRLQHTARQMQLCLRAEVRDVVAYPPAPKSFDVIVVSRFLERRLAPALIAALRPAGLLFYQTFMGDAVGAVGPQNPAYRLAAQELLALFRPLRVLVYREETQEALLVAQQSDDSKG